MVDRQKALMDSGTSGGLAAPGYPVRSVGNALEILLMLRDRETISISEASRELGVARSTAHRLLSMLAHYDLAQRDTGSGRAFRVGPALVSLGVAAIARMDIRRQARPHMEWLADEVEETVTLMSLEGTNVRFLDWAPSPRTIQMAGLPGVLHPAHCTSAGKAILAQFPIDELTKLYPDETLHGPTERSITSRHELLTVLKEVRRAGYAMNIGETDPGLAAVGVAIPNILGPPIAGLGIAAPETRMSPELTQRIAKAAQRAAQAIANSFE